MVCGLDILEKMTAHAFRSKKAKGKRAEKKFASLIRQYGLDKSARVMIGSGAFDNYKGDIYAPKVKFSFEVKNQENIKLWEWWEQAESQSSMAKPPVLVFMSNYRPMLCTMKVETFLDLLREIEDLK